MGEQPYSMWVGSPEDHRGPLASREGQTLVELIKEGSLRTHTEVTEVYLGVQVLLHYVLGMVNSVGQLGWVTGCPDLNIVSECAWGQELDGMSL